MTLESALSVDRSGRYMLAASLYESLAAGGTADLETLLNLAVLYWRATDFGIAAGQRLPPEFFHMAALRCRELLAEAERRFPESTAPRFWRKYIDWADLDAPFERTECLELLREDPGNPLPALYLFSDSLGEEFEAEARELLRRCRADVTIRNGYVASVIETFLRRRARLY